MKYYVAARFGIEDQLNVAVSKVCEKLGWELTASWLDKAEQGLLRSEIAVLDLYDVDRADAIILFTHPRGEKHSGGGRFVEFGYALAKNKLCFVVGSYENVFCHHPAVKVYGSIEDLISDNER